MRLAVARYDGVTLWWAGTNADPVTLAWKGAHLGVIFSPDGKNVVTSMQENELHGWRLDDGKDMRMSGYPTKPKSLSWSVKGRFLASSGANAAILWPFHFKDGPMGRQPLQLGAREAVVTRVACHPREELVAVGYQDGMVHGGALRRRGGGAAAPGRRKPGLGARMGQGRRQPRLRLRGRSGWGHQHRRYLARCPHFHLPNADALRSTLAIRFAAGVNGDTYESRPLRGEASLYFVVMTALFRARHRFGIGLFFCALGTMHFLETYLAAILYVELPGNMVISPGSAVLFSGKLVMLLLVYIREDAATVRQPIYGLLIGNFLMVGMVLLLRHHIVAAGGARPRPRFRLHGRDGLADGVGHDAALHRQHHHRPALRALGALARQPADAPSASLHHDGADVRPDRLLRGAARVPRPAAACLRRRMGRQDGGSGVLQHRGRALPPLGRGQHRLRPYRRRLTDVFDTLTYRERYEALLRETGRDALTGLFDRGRFDRDGATRHRRGDRTPAGRSACSSPTSTISRTSTTSTVTRSATRRFG